MARVTNTGNDEAAYQIEVSIKGADGGISSHRFWFQSVPPGGTGEEEATLAATSGTSDFGKPKIYLDDVRRIT